MKCLQRCAEYRSELRHVGSQIDDCGVFFRRMAEKPCLVGFLTKKNPLAAGFFKLGKAQNWLISERLAS